MIIQQQANQVGQWLCVIERKQSGQTFCDLQVLGTADDNSVDVWNAGVANGILVLGDNVTIKRPKLSRLHVGIEVRGHNVKIEDIEADLISGDVIQGNGNSPRICSLNAFNLIKTLPDDEYHPDVVHWRGEANKGVIEYVAVNPSNHPLARKQYQGLMFSDGVFRGWLVKDVYLPDCHPEHGVTFAEAHDCNVENVSGGGAVRFRDLNGVASTGCKAINVMGYVEGAEMGNKELYDAASELNLSGDLPRGIRNNNPGNVEHSSRNKWLGLADPASDGRYCRFTHPQYGIRAMLWLLLTYQTKHRLKTIKQIIERYAPRQDKNATDEYIEHVSKRAGVKASEPISLRDFKIAVAVITAMIEFENGMQPYPAELIETAVGLVITTDEESSVGTVKPVVKSTEQLAVGGAAVGTGSMAGIEWLKTQVEANQTLVMNGLTKAQEQLSGVQTLGWIQIALLVAVLASIWYLAWRRGEASFLGIR